MTAIATQQLKIARYGWRPDLPDARDYVAEPASPDLEAAQGILDDHTTIDFRQSGLLPAPYDQGQLGSCTANSAAANLEYNRARLGLASVGTPSRLFIYYNERVMQGTVQQDSGATIRESIKAAHLYGAPPETEWAYDITKFADQPPVADFTDALGDVDLTYQRVQRAAVNLVAALHAQLAVQIGFTVYSSFEQDITSNGIMPMPAKGEQVEGGHAVLVVGVTWIDNAGYWIVRNSWGPSWADGGYFYMPLEYLLTSSLSSDFWQVSVVGAAGA